MPEITKTASDDGTPPADLPALAAAMLNGVGTAEEQVETASEAIDETQTRIKDLENRAKTAEGRAKAKVQKELEAERAEREELKAQMAALQASLLERATPEEREEFQSKETQRKTEADKTREQRLEMRERILDEDDEMVQKYLKANLEEGLYVSEKNVEAFRKTVRGDASAETTTATTKTKELPRVGGSQAAPAGEKTREQRAAEEKDPTKALQILFEGRF